MANTIQMKRSAATGTSAPTGLAAGELAWLNNGANGGNGKLYIGSSDDTPQMLHILNLGVESGSCDWETIAVYTCTNSCVIKSYAEEYAWAQTSQKNFMC